MCLAQGHNAVTPVRLEPAALRSRVKHSTTEPLRSLLSDLLPGIWDTVFNSLTTFGDIEYLGKLIMGILASL